MISTARLDVLERGIDVEPPPHRPVLLRETMELLRPAAGAVLVDATVGAGGHTAAMLEAAGPEGRVFGIDRDPAALAIARERLAAFGDRFVAIHGDYRNIVDLVRAHGAFAVDGIVADLGVSSMQIDDPARGFSFRVDGPLDMRMDPSSGEPGAADLLAELPEAELRRILWTFGEERLAGPIAREIVRARGTHPLRSTRDLAVLVERVLGPRARRYRIHPATRSFQALRIAVNRELEGLAEFVTDAASILRRGGRLCVIGFHSLEDRVVKHSMRALAERCICPPGLPVCGCGRENLVRLLTTRPISPDADEIGANPRSRSARLRGVERL